MFDLLRWRVEALSGDVPRIDPPGYGLWEALIVGWILCATIAHISDLRSR